MAHVADHLSVSALEQRYRSCTDATAARHVQTIWLLAKGHHIAEVAATVSFARRWVERLLARYNAQGLQALGDLRHRNGARPSVLKPDLLDKLKDRLCEPPPDGGLWTSPKVAAWMASELGPVIRTKCAANERKTPEQNMASHSSPHLIAGCKACH